MGLASLVQDIVYKISGRVLSSSGLYTPSDYQYDYALGGIPFLSAASDTRPDLEGPIEQRKQQFDNQKDPGEYSLSQWWLRSQSSFIGGEGVIYQDPDTQGTAKNVRFAHSVGVDPFSDPDNLTLLRRTFDSEITDLNLEIGPALVATYAGDTEQDMWVAKGRTVYGVDIFSDGTFMVTGTAAMPYSGIGTATILDGIVVFESPTISGDGYMYYLDPGSAANTGIWKASGNGAITMTRVYVSTAVRTAMAKARGLLAFSDNNEFYMLDPYVAANTALPTPNAVVPQDQLITSITDGPDAVYVAANDSNNGYIYKTTFDSNGVVNGLALTAVMPTGERINNIAAYVNTFLVITTQTGVRVGSFTGDGIQYGPSIMNVTQGGGDETYNFSTTRSGFGRIAFYKSFAFVTEVGESQHDGDRGIMCIDLSTVNQDSNTGASSNAYCTWVYLPGNTERIYDIAVTNDGRIIQGTTDNFSGESGRVLMEHPTELIESGYLDTGRCRFNTIEPKLFKYFSIRTDDPLRGEITVAVLDQGGGVTTYVTYGESFAPGTEDIATPVPTGPQNWIALRFTLRRDADEPELGPRLDSWQIKALPGTLKQRRITRQFLCFNSEEDKTGQQISGDTQSLDKLTAVRQMCQRGDTVTFQDLANNISDQVVIDDYQFTMLAPPGPNSENYGGYLTVVMRTVADSVPALSLAGTVEEE